jgi:amidophosphoribosyltransferase
MIEHIELLAKKEQKEHIMNKLQTGTLTQDDINQLNNTHLRIEKITHKDQLVRTFITQDKKRLNLVGYTYDITRGIVNQDDTLVVIDDSIVRGTTLREAILNQLIRLNPKKIIIVSSAPPILYPDCYGIDMSQLNRFIAFQAVITLLHEQGNHILIDTIADKCKKQRGLPASKISNYVKELYNQVSLEQLETKVAELVRPQTEWTGEIQIIYQTIEGLHAAIPQYTGDWYFTGDYPTPGGYKVINTSFLQWYEGNSNARAY